ncbi:MAG: Coenzyme F420 hydrogenase/dehydrogenase, beta subunit C-terminal domain [Pseudomonadota bacterium]
MSADGLPVRTVAAVPAADAAPQRGLCTDCGVSRTAEPKRCGRACQFIKPRYAELETAVHGRCRDPERGDELHFGPFRGMYSAWLADRPDGAQWSGIVTRLAERALTTGTVEAVLTVAPDPQDRWRPVPVLVTDPAELDGCRGMRMGYAPLLSLLEPAIEKGIRRLAVIGIPCQVYALRALQDELGLDELYVIGTPCSDNTTTENFHQFLALLSERPDDVTYLEFRPDYHVEIRYSDGARREIPFLQLPIADLPGDFFPLTCRTCVDYTNVLADVTVGYMAGAGRQWVVARNRRGEALLALLDGELSLRPLTSAGNRRGAVRGFLANTLRAAGGLPVRRMPAWLRPLVGWLMPRIGPRGLEFARARVEMKAVETVVHLRRQLPQRLKSMVPAHVWSLVEPYGLEPGAGERDDDTRRRR